MFKRRSRRSPGRTLAELVYPRGGWLRATSYVLHRLRRLPDSPDRIARGIAAGVFVSFTPLFGAHFVVAALLAWAMRGNVIAALLATFVGNPLTFPVIMSVSVGLGNWMLGQPPGMQLPQIAAAFGSASAELWGNLGALVAGEAQNWDGLALFFRVVFLPYLLGGIIPGVVCGLAFYYGSRPFIIAYQKRRKKKLRARFEKARLAVAQRAAVPKGEDGGSDRHGPTPR